MPLASLQYGYTCIVHKHNLFATVVDWSILMQFGNWPIESQDRGF